MNRSTNELTYVDVLYSINTKTEPAGSLSPDVPTKVDYLTGSTISISDLLDYVNKYYPDILPEDVLKHYNYDSRPDGKLGESVLYQSRTSELDNEYLEAVKNNDLEKAQKLVEEAAKKAGYDSNSDYQGTSAFNGSAPSLNGYFESKEERIEAWKNGDFEDTQTLGDFVYGIDIGDLEFALFDNRNYRNADTATKESIENLRNVINNQNNKVIMYRSVPNSVKENRFRNGDWISPSYLYAVENARIHGWGEDYRIIKNEVSIEEVWWDGNDINEWGYDNGNENEVYKNIDNNVKLLNVTYDDNGNVIPLSERFKEDKSDIRYQSRRTKPDYNFSKALSNEEKARFESALKNNSRGLLIGDNGVLLIDYENTDNYKLICYNGDKLFPEIKSVYKIEGFDYNIHNSRRYIIDLIVELEKGNLNGKTDTKTARTILQNFPLRIGEVFKIYNKRTCRYNTIGRGKSNDNESNRKNAEIEPDRTGVSENAGQGISDSGLNFDFPQFQMRPDNGFANRRLLANALEKSAQNNYEKNKVKLYKENIDQIEELETRLDEVNEKIKKATSVKAAERTREQRTELVKLNNIKKILRGKIARKDKQLLNFESMEPMKKLIESEKKKARHEARINYEAKLKEKNEKHNAELASLKERDRERLADVIESKDKIIVAEREKRKTMVKGIREARDKKEIIRKTIKKIKDIDKLLNRSKADKTVKQGQRDTASKLLSLSDILLDTNISNADIVRRGVETATPEEQKLLDEYLLIIGDADTELSEAQRRKVYQLNSKLKDLFIRERERLNRATVKQALTELSETYKSVENAPEAYLKNSFDKNIIEAIDNFKEEIGGTLVKDMNVEQVQKLHDIVTMILTSIRNANKHFAEEMKLTCEETSNNVMNEILSAKGEKEIRNLIANKILDFQWRNLKPIYAFRLMGSKTFEKIYWNLQKGELKWYIDLAEAKQFKAWRSYRKGHLLGIRSYI